MQFDSTKQFNPRPPPAVQDILKALEIGAAVTAETSLTALLKRTLWDTFRRQNVFVKLSQQYDALDNHLMMQYRTNQVGAGPQQLMVDITSFAERIACEGKNVTLRGPMQVEVHRRGENDGYALIWSQRYQVADAGRPAGNQSSQEA